MQYNLSGSVIDRQDNLFDFDKGAIVNSKEKLS